MFIDDQPRILSHMCILLSIQVRIVNQILFQHLLFQTQIYTNLALYPNR